MLEDYAEIQSKLLQMITYDVEFNGSCDSSNVGIYCYDMIYNGHHCLKVGECGPGLDGTRQFKDRDNEHVLQDGHQCHHFICYFQVSEPRSLTQVQNLILSKITLPTLLKNGLKQVRESFKLISKISKDSPLRLNWFA